MSPTNNGWPNMPGVPLNPETKACHWVVHPKDLGHEGGEMAIYWNRIGWWMPGTPRLIMPSEMTDYTYEGPCLTPAHHAASLAAARWETVEACAAIAEKARKNAEIYLRAAQDSAHKEAFARDSECYEEMRDDIRAMPIPDTDALATMLAAAEAKGREEALKEARARLTEIEPPYRRWINREEALALLNPHPERQK